MHISINTYNIIQRRFIRQEKLLRKTLHSLESSKKYFTLPRKGKRFLKLKERFIQYLIDQSIKYSVVFGHQEKIADYLDCDVRHLRKIIKDLRQSGWITVISTPGLCNIYMLHDIFDDRAFCIGMNYVFNNLLVDKDMYRVMHNSIYVQNELNKKSITDIKAHQYQEVVCDDERFRPKETNRETLDEIFGQQKHDLSKMPSLYKDEYTHEFLICDDGALLEFENQFTYNYTEPTKGVIEDIFSPNISLKSESICVPNKKGSTAMQALPTVQEILSYADQLKSIRPLLHGAIILSAFPKEVVLHADERTLKCKKPLLTALDKWKYLISVCKGYCAENKIETSWSMSLNVRNQYSIHKDTPMFDENHSPEKVHTPAPFIKGKSIGGETPIRQVTYAEAVKNNQQWSNSLPHLDKDKEFSGALNTLTEMATSNPFAALLMKNIEKLKPQTVGHPESVVSKPSEPFDQETLDIVAWIKSNWDDKLFPHSNKWVHENIARVLQEGPTSAQYLDGSFMTGMKHIKRLMEALINKPKVQAPVEFDVVDEGVEDYGEDPFGDRK